MIILKEYMPAKSHACSLLFYLSRKICHFYTFLWFACSTAACTFLNYSELSDLIQAPVSDREYRATLPETAEMIDLAATMISEGRAMDLLPREANPDAPITAYRCAKHVNFCLISLCNNKNYGLFSCKLLHVTLEPSSSQNLSLSELLLGT